jgi:hypothetical protein
MMWDFIPRGSPRNACVLTTSRGNRRLPEFILSNDPRDIWGYLSWLYIYTVIHGTSVTCLFRYFFLSPIYVLFLRVI